MADVLLNLFARHGYAIVFGAILVDAAGLPIPGELLLLIFGALARHGSLDPMLGALTVPLAKYQFHNLRIRRPHGIRPTELDTVIDSVVTDLGKQYDNRSLVDLMLMLLSPIKVGPLKRRTIETCLGNCTDLQVICSGLIAKAFHRAGFAILPSLTAQNSENGRRQA